MNEGLGLNAREFLVITVHSVLSNSGFAPIGRIKMPEDWSSTSFLMSIRYTLPRLNTKDEVILLKFQSSEHFVMAYGFVSCIGESYVYSVSLDERTFPPNLDSTSDENENENKGKNMLELWKTVEDSLALPLLSDVGKTGMFHPPRILLLPYDMQLEILNALSGYDIARLQCVCVELNNLASNDDLWEMKFKKDFPLAAWRKLNVTQAIVQEDGIWKTNFGTYHLYRRLFGDVEDEDEDNELGI